MRAIKELGLIIAVAGAMLLTGMALHGCDKVVPAKPPAAEAGTGKVETAPTGPTTELERMGAVSVGTATPASTVATPTVKAKAHAHAVSQTDRDAYATAYRNAARANTLLGAHVYKTSPKDEIGSGSFSLSRYAGRPCVSDVAS